LVKHTITERSTSARITIVALHPVVFALSYLYFPKAGTTIKMFDKRWKKSRLGKELYRG
jgi:hypothetical protein